MLFGIEQPIQCPAAGLHAGCHGSFREAVLIHGGFDLIGEDLLDGLFLAFLKNALFGEKAVERRADLALFLESHLYLLTSPRLRT